VQGDLTAARAASAVPASVPADRATERLQPVSADRERPVSGRPWLAGVARSSSKQAGTAASMKP